MKMNQLGPPDNSVPQGWVPAPQAVGNCYSIRYKKFPEVNLYFKGEEISFWTPKTSYTSLIIWSLYVMMHVQVKNYFHEFFSRQTEQLPEESHHNLCSIPENSLFSYILSFARLSNSSLKCLDSWLPVMFPLATTGICIVLEMSLCLVSVITALHSGLLPSQTSQLPLLMYPKTGLICLTWHYARRLCLVVLLPRSLNLSYAWVSVQLFVYHNS